MLKSCGPPEDVLDLQFKLQCRLKIFENKEVSQFANAYSLVTCASRYGLLFVGTNSHNFQVIQTQTLQHYGPKEKDDYPKRDVQIPSAPKHLSVNCDSTILAVVVERSQCPTVIFYDVLSFLQQNIKIIKEIRLSATPNVFIQEINWNPALPAIFTTCKSDGSLGVYELKGESVEINELPTAAAATCFCWSPKGKQIAVGSRDGKITQYKPDLKAVKVIAEPKLEGGCSLIALQWVSNYQFVGSYHRAQDGTSFIIVVDAPKTGETTFTNYEDICYSGSARLAQFYMILQQNWNFLMVASANSTEVGVLSNTGEAWTQWIMPGSARAELPLSSEKEETLPIGMTFDISSTTPLPWEESTIPPCPLLCVLSHQGVLHCFNVVYLKPGIPSVCTPPDNIKDTSGLSCFVAKNSQSQTGEIKIGTSQPQIASNDTKFVMAPNLRQISQLHAANTPTKNVTFNFSASSQSTPLAPLKTNTNVASKSLFAGQTTLTPIKPKNQSLFSEQSSITPANQSTIFSALNPTSGPQINTAPVKPIVISAAPVKPIQAAVPRNNLPIKQENQEETDAMMQQMIKDEWMYLEAELKILLKMGGSLKLNIGSDDEKIAMVQQLESLDEFVKEAVEISVGQSNEIHCLKQNLLQSWAWYEEAISHYNASKNEAVALLIKCQPLDTLSEKRLREIKQLDFYIKSQISQAHKTLDEQWDSFQDYAKKTHKVKMPTMETIFLTMVKQNAILQKQILLLKQISFRLTKTSSNDIGNLTAGFEDLTLNPQQIRQLQYDKVKSYSKNLSQGKSKQLKDLLNKREITKVTAVKPQISSFAINQSPSSRVRQSISMLGANVSPAAKASIAKSLSFAQSPTPKTPENIEKSTPSFSSLLKTGPVISSSQGSAFTPIGASSTSNKITTPSFSFAATTSSKNQAPSSTFSSIFKPSSQTATFSFGSTSTPKPASSTSALFGNQANNASFSFSTLSTTTSTGNVEVSKTTTKPPSGVASIFANIQSVIDNATTTTTTTQTTSPTKPLFGSFSSSDSGHLFGSVSKPTASNTTTFSFKATPADKPQLTNVDQNKTSPIIKSEPSKIITVSLFDSKSASDQTNTESGSQSLFGNNTGPIFGNLSATGSSSLFSSSPAATTTTASNSLQSSVIDSSGSIFGNKASSTSTSGPATPTSVFGSTKTTLEASTATTTTPTAVIAPVTASTSVFGTSTSVLGTTTTTSTIFGTPTTSASSTFEAPAIFGAPTTSTSTSVFGKPTTSITTSVFGTPTTSTSVFGTPTTTTSTPVFGTPTTSTSTSVFGTPTTTTSTLVFGTPTTTSTSVFGTPTISTSTSVFGASTTSTSTSVFGTPTTTTSSSVFGTPAASTAPSAFGAPTSSIFGATTTTFGTPSTSSNIFGAPPSAGSNIFSSSTAVFGATPSGNIFASPPISSASAFGAPATNIFSPTTTTSIFGGASTTASPFGSQTGPMFGVTATTTAAGGVFGQPPAFGSQSVFGGAPAAAGSSVFGQAAAAPAVPAASGNIFGSTSSTNVFGSGFGAASPATSNVFGSPPETTPSSNFGFGGLNVGSQPSGSLFGSSGATTFGQSPNANPFAKVETTPAFGSSSSSIFGGATTSASNIFGSPAATTASSIFGGSGGGGFGSTSPSAFGSSTFGQTSTFGSSSFGSPQTTPGPFSGGPATAQGAFGSPPSYPGSSGFGSSGGSMFGGSTFGTSTFGTSSFGQSTFGAPSTFGSPDKGFGGSAAAPTGAFGATARQESTIFGNLANQNTIGFGTLAQQASTPTSIPFSGGASFSSWR